MRESKMHVVRRVTLLEANVDHRQVAPLEAELRRRLHHDQSCLHYTQHPTQEMAIRGI